MIFKWLTNYPICNQKTHCSWQAMCYFIFHGFKLLCSDNVWCHVWYHQAPPWGGFQWHCCKITVFPGMYEECHPRTYPHYPGKCITMRDYCQEIVMFELEMDILCLYRTENTNVACHWLAHCCGKSNGERRKTFSYHNVFMYDPMMGLPCILFQWSTIKWKMINVSYYGGRKLTSEIVRSGDAHMCLWTS